MAFAVAALIAVVGVVVAVFNNRASGAIMRVADQVALGAIPILMAAVIVYLATRPRLRVGPAGLAVRNVVAERLIPWSDVAGFYFPPGKGWARVEIQAYEYVPVVAIQRADRQRAVDAMDTVRELMDRYQPDVAEES